MLTRQRALWSAAGMANVLSDEKRQQVLALGRLGWSLRKIEGATGVRRETAGAYLRAAGVAVRAPRQVVLAPKPATADGVSTDSGPSNPATGEGVSADYAARPAWPPPGRAPAASACEPYREIIEQAVSRGRKLDEMPFRSCRARLCREEPTMTSRLRDKVCLINGVASTIGHAVARRFADEGAVVVGVDREDHA